MAQPTPVASPAPQPPGPPPSHSPQQFCLRWNNYQANLTNVFDQLLQSESFVDVTLACDGHSVKAHKMVLSACSPYFQSLFVDNPCQHPIVILKDIHWADLKAVVEFMYKGEINVNQEQIGPLLKVAETLKVRGLADVNGEQEMTRAAEVTRKKRRRSSDGETEDGQAPSPLERAPLELVTTSPGSPHPLMALPPPPPPMPPPSAPSADDMEIKPGIAEMIREEERNAASRSGRPGWMSSINRCSFPYEAKMLESSHAWLGASTSSLSADSYQYQLQSMWQKCWNTNQSLVHNLRFRERGPLKSWRPETMAEAILSVLKEGLSLSQAARKYDIPYPTFVLYANRVHNMLGPSADGGSDLRPKGRGRPQRILLGIWPEEHIRGVIRAVVFRDPQHMKEESFPRLHTPATPYLKPEPPRPQADFTPEALNFTTAGNDPLDFAARPAAPAAAAMVAVAQGLRQQMLTHHDHHLSSPAPPYLPGNHLAPSPLPSPVDSSPTGSPITNVEHKHIYQTGNGGTTTPQSDNKIDARCLKNSLADWVALKANMAAMGYKAELNDTVVPTARADHLFQDEIEDLVKRPQSNDSNKQQKMNMGYKPIPMVADLSTNRSEHLFQEDMNSIMKRVQAPQVDTPKLKVSMGVSGVTYKPPCDSYTPVRTELFADAAMEDLVKPPPRTPSKDPPMHLPPATIDQRSD